MTHHKNAFFNNTITLVELLISCAIFYIVYVITSGSWTLTSDYLVLLLCILLLWPYMFKQLDISKIYHTNPHSYILIRHIVALSLGLLGLTFFSYILNLTIERFFLVTYILIDFVVLYLFIIAIYNFAKAQRKKGIIESYVYIIGDKNIGGFIHKLETNAFWGYKIKGIASDDPDVIEKYKDTYNTCSIEELKSKLGKESMIDEVLYCIPVLDPEVISHFVYTCLNLGITFRVTSDVLSLSSTKSKIYYFGETPFFSFQNTPSQTINLKIKSLFDKVFSFVTLVCLIPVFIVTAICIKLDSKGPILFKQTRCGCHGRKFTLYKFRSMCDNAENLLDSLKDENEMEGPVFKIKNDARITRVGRFIRKTSIDELPQFYNVLRGDMSIVGPRPPLPEEVEKYEPWQLRRLSVRPGLTCIWQVSGRNNIPFERWMKLDLQYIDTWSLSLDFMIILKTIKTVIKHDGQ